MNKADLKDKGRVKDKAGKALKVALGHERKDNPWLVLALAEDAVSPVPSWHDPADLTINTAKGKAK
jgi:hypothetical protein